MATKPYEQYNNTTANKAEKLREPQKKAIGLHVYIYNFSNRLSRA